MKNRPEARRYTTPQGYFALVIEGPSPETRIPGDEVGALVQMLEDTAAALRVKYEIYRGTVPGTGY